MQRKTNGGSGRKTNMAAKQKRKRERDDAPSLSLSCSLLWTWVNNLNSLYSIFLGAYQVGGRKYPGKTKCERTYVRHSGLFLLCAHIHMHMYVCYIDIPLLELQMSTWILFGVVVQQRIDRNREISVQEKKGRSRRERYGDINTESLNKKERERGREMGKESEGNEEKERVQQVLTIKSTINMRNMGRQSYRKDLERHRQSLIMWMRESKLQIYQAKDIDRYYR